MLEDKYNNQYDGSYGEDVSLDEIDKSYTISYGNSRYSEKRGFDYSRIIDHLRTVNWGIVVVIVAMIVVCAIVYTNRETIINAVVHFITGIISIIVIIAVIGACLMAIIFPNGIPGRRGRRRWWRW